MKTPPKKPARLFVLVLAALLLFSLGLTACKRSNVSTNFGEAVLDWKAGGTSGASHVQETQLDTYTNGDFGDSLGFDVTAYPDSAALSPQKFYAIEQWFGQIEYFTADDRVLVLRIARDNSKDVRTTYTENHNTQEESRTVDGIEVSLARSGNGCTMVFWEKEGFQYLIHSNFQQDPPSDDEVNQLVRGLQSEDTTPTSSKRS